MQDFRNLKVWKAALALTVDVYRDTQQFPDVERYGLLSQVRRASISIGANIAEGCGRDSDADFARFLKISLGSANEVHHCLVLALELGYLDPRIMSRREAAVGEVKRMLWSLIQKLRGGKSATSLAAQSLWLTA